MTTAKPAPPKSQNMTDADVAGTPTAHEDPDACYIVFKQPYIENINGQAVQMTKDHRVLRDEWTAYEKEHGL